MTTADPSPSRPGSGVARDALLALSGANLGLFEAWAEYLPSATPRENLYLITSLPARAHYAALVLDVLFIAALLFALLRLLRGGGRAVLLARSAAVLLGPLLALNAARMRSTEITLGAVRAHAGLLGLGLLAAAGAGVALLAVLRAPQLLQLAEGAVLALSPFVLVTLGQAGYIWLRYDALERPFADRALAPPLPPRAPSDPRVVWIVFDSLDQRIAFEERPPSVRLPELDRLRGESLFATEAYPPARKTLLSFPALISGRLVTAAHPEGLDDLMLTLGDDAARTEIVRWSRLPCLFAEARELGFETALIGWVHPYCRTLSGSLGSCYSAGLAFERREKGIVRAALEGLVRVASSFPAAGRFVGDRGGLRLRRQRLEMHRELRDRALRLAADPRFGLVMLHLSVPHEPGIYDVRTGELSVHGRTVYLDNLALADRTLGEIRSAMERAGLWERSTVIVTSDHWWRMHERATRFYPVAPEEARFLTGTPFRIPFLVKPASGPGAGTGGVLDGPFNTLLLHDLSLDVLLGRVHTLDEVRAWLEANRSRVRIPFEAYRVED